jgi:uncharacterized iron-regulated protein
MKRCLHRSVLSVALIVSPQLVCAAVPLSTPAMLSQYSDIVHSAYVDRVQSAKTLRQAVDTLR